MIDKSKRGLIGTKRFMYQNVKFPIKIILQLFNTLIEPLLTYGCEIWALDSKNIEHFKLLETIAYNFYKELICIPKSTPNCAVNIKLGVPPNSIQVYSKSVELFQ